jgi:hypothetical protein
VPQAGDSSARQWMTAVLRATFDGMVCGTTEAADESFVFAKRSICAVVYQRAFQFRHDKRTDADSHVIAFRD